jgi:hypothetical protein
MISSSGTSPLKTEPLPCTDLRSPSVVSRLSASRNGVRDTKWAPSSGDPSYDASHARPVSLAYRQSCGGGWPPDSNQLTAVKAGAVQPNGSTNLKVEGNCYCGVIVYEAEVQPGTATVCHCNDCQSHSGSAFRSNISAPAESFRLRKGSPRTYLKTAASGAKRLLAFCENCGTSLYACAADAPTTYSLRIGTIQQRHALGTPGRQIWVKRRFSWVNLPDTVESFDGQP